MRRSASLHGFGPVIDIHGIAGADPGFQAAEQGVHAFISVREQKSRSMRRAALVWTRAIEHDFTLAREVGAPFLDSLEVERNGTRNAPPVDTASARGAHVGHDGSHALLDQPLELIHRDSPYALLVPRSRPFPPEPANTRRDQHNARRENFVTQ